MTVSERSKDLLLAAALIAVGVAALVAINSTRQTNISTTGALGFAVLPTIYAWLLVLLALLLMGTVVFGKRPSPRPRADAGAAAAEVPRAVGPTKGIILLRTWRTAALLLAYVAALPHLPFVLVAARLAALCERAAKSDAYKKFGEQFGFVPVWMPGAQFEKLMRGELGLFKETKAKYISK